MGYKCMIKDTIWCNKTPTPFHCLSLFYGVPHSFMMTPTSNVVIVDPYHDLNFLLDRRGNVCYSFYKYLKILHVWNKQTIWYLWIYVLIMVFNNEFLILALRHFFIHYCLIDTSKKLCLDENSLIFLTSSNTISRLWI